MQGTPFLGFREGQKTVPGVGRSAIASGVVTSDQKAKGPNRVASARMAKMLHVETLPSVGRKADVSSETRIFGPKNTHSEIRFFAQMLAGVGCPQ